MLTDIIQKYEDTQNMLEELIVNWKSCLSEAQVTGDKEKIEEYDVIVTSIDLTRNLLKDFLVFQLNDTKEQLNNREIK